MQAFDSTLEDDLNTPRALAVLRELVRDNSIAPQSVLEAAFAMDEALGLGLRSLLDEDLCEDESLKQEIEEIIALRAEAKKAKDFNKADSLRQGLKERGIILEDGPCGTSWRRTR